MKIEQYFSGVDKKTVEVPQTKLPNDVFTADNIQTNKEVEMEQIEAIQASLIGQIEKEKVITVHQERVGFMNYKLEVSEKQLEEWSLKVDQIQKLLQERDFEALRKFINNEKLIERARTTLEHSQFLSPEKRQHVKDLLAVSIWIIDNQNKWPGNLDSGFRLIKGGLQRLENFTRAGGENGPSCLDMSAITHALTQKRGIPGEIQRLGTKGRGSRFEHRYWRSKEGYTVDTLWGIDIGGVYLTDEEYETRRIKRKQEKSLGLAIGSFNPSDVDDCIEDYTDTDEFLKKKSA